MYFSMYMLFHKVQKTKNPAPPPWASQGISPLVCIPLMQLIGLSGEYLVGSCQGLRRKGLAQLLRWPWVSEWGPPSFLLQGGGPARSAVPSLPQPHCIPREVCVDLEHWLPGLVRLALNGP